MAFWIFMLVFSVMIPVMMISFGISFIRSAPKQINYVFGYRTSMSMKNRETWEFAHKHCGRLWTRFGAALLPLSVIPFLFVLNCEKNVVGNVGTIVIMIQLAVLILSIFPTEIALKRNFDRDGNRVIKDKNKK